LRDEAELTQVEINRFFFCLIKNENPRMYVYNSSIANVATKWLSKKSRHPATCAVFFFVIVSLFWTRNNLLFFSPEVLPQTWIAVSCLSNMFRWMHMPSKFCNWSMYECKWLTIMHVAAFGASGLCVHLSSC
jgi:hypothetical protein